MDGKIFEEKLLVLTHMHNVSSNLFQNMLSNLADKVVKIQIDDTGSE
jgi:hypothetical protein